MMMMKKKMRMWRIKMVMIKTAFFERLMTERG